MYSHLLSYLLTICKYFKYAALIPLTDRNLVDRFARLARCRLSYDLRHIDIPSKAKTGKVTIPAV